MDVENDKTYTVYEKKLPDPPPYRVHPEYMEVIWEEAVRLSVLASLGPKERYALRKAAVSKGALDRARALWGLVRLGGSDLPPPVVRIQSRADYLWLLYGRLLRKKSLSTFEALLTSLHPLVEAQLETLRATRELATRTKTHDLLEVSVDSEEDLEEAWFRQWAETKEAK